MNMKGIPNKNNKNFKNSLSKTSTTPVRFGEQELMNMLLFNEEEMLYSYLDFCSSNKEDRESLVKTLLTCKDPSEIDLPKKSEFNTVKSITETYFKCLGIELEK